MSDQSYRILIADDEENILHLYKTVLSPQISGKDDYDSEISKLEEKLFSETTPNQLKENQYEIVTCNQAEQAVKEIEKSIAEDNRYAIAFLDIRMPPGKDGIWAAETIRKLDPMIAIVIVTAFSDIDVKDIADKIPPQDKLLFLLKPFHPQEILQFSKALSSKWKAEQEVLLHQNKLNNIIDNQQQNLLKLNRKIEKDSIVLQKTESLLSKHKALLEEVFNSVREGIIMLDMEGKILLSNPFFCNLLDLPPSDVNGKIVYSLMDETSRVELYRFMRSSDFAESKSINLTLNPQDEAKHLYITIYPRFSGTTRIGYFSVIQDLTEQKQLEFQFLQSQKMEAMGKLAGGIAHDFNNLLTVISGNSELLLGEDIGDENIQIVNEIKQSSIDAQKLTKQLLYFSRQQKLSKTNTNLNNIIVNLNSVLRRIIGVNISIQTEMENDLGMINADITLLKQMIINLVINAKDALPNGGVIKLISRNVSIDEAMTKTIENSSTGHYVCLTIEDNGTGIKKDILPRIFEPFYTTKEYGKGTGLGLSTVFGIVAQHNGWINVRSKVNLGTSFDIFIPRTDELYIKAQEEDKKIDTSGNNEMVLVAENNKAVLRFTEDALKRNGYRVLCAETILEARKLFDQHSDEIDILITDLVFPDSTGIFLIQHVLLKNSDLKVILTSGYSTEDDRSKLAENMKIPVLNKPYSIKELLIFIKSVESIGMDTDEPCELRDQCTFFKSVTKSTNDIMSTWAKMFCNSKEKSERCKRKKYFLETGTQPVPEMTPTGKMIT